MQPLDPLLIGSFPAPPSHIPTSPNPPPSRPPSLPLPPVPGPSRISTQESLYLLSSTSSSSDSRSRSSSKVSESSSLDNASLKSAGRSRPVSPVSIVARAMTPYAGIEFLIQEHSVKNDELLNVHLELQDEAEMDPEELLLHRSSPIHLRKASHHRAANDSISSIDVSDILAATSNLSDDDYHTHMTTLRPTHSLSRQQSRIRRTNHGLSLADPIDPQTLSHQAGVSSAPITLAFPSTSPPISPVSPVFPIQIASQSTKESKKTNAPQKPPTPPSSPDIPSILASSIKTRPPQYRTRVSSNASATSSLGVSQRARSRSRQRVSSTTSNTSSVSAYNPNSGSVAPATRQGNPQQGGLASPAVVPRRLNSGGAGGSCAYGHHSRSLSNGSASGPMDRRSWIPHDEFGRPIPIPLSESPMSISRPSSGGVLGPEEWDHDIVVETVEARGNGDDDSGSDDSSIDLHTPLPHYMLRHGLLSPKSKLLNELTESRNGRESVMSSSSTGTGYANLKDPRNTEKRRIRHRDGKLLKGGIGLTTGLGWSDSEDEDAPSALTHRLSTINLSRSTSFSSLHLSRSINSIGSFHSSRSFYGKPSKMMQHPPTSYSHSPSMSVASNGSLAKSFSSGMLYDVSQQEPMPPSLDELDEWGVIDAARFGKNPSTGLTPMADSFGSGISSPPPRPSVSSMPLKPSTGGLPRAQTMPNIKPKSKTSSGMPRPGYGRKRTGSGSKSDAGSRVSTSTVGSVNSNMSGFSGSTSFSGFSTRDGIPEEREKDLEEEELMMKTTTSVGAGSGTTKYRAHTMSGRKGYKYSKSVSGGSGSISEVVGASAISHSSSKSSTSTSGSGAYGLSSSPSTSSSMSIPLPVTPCDDGVCDEAATVATSSSTTLPGMVLPASNKDKMLPPLPPTLRRIPGKKELNLDADDMFMSKPVSGSKVTAAARGREEEVVRSTVTPKGFAFPGASASLNSRARTPSTMSSGIATPAGRKTPTQGVGARTNGTLTSLPSSMSTPRPLRLASSPHVNSTPTPSSAGLKDRAPVPVPSIRSATPSSGLPRPPPSPLVASNVPQSAPAGTTDFRPLSASTSGSSILSSLTPGGERKPRTGTGMVYRNSSAGPSKLRLPAVAAANGNTSASTSGIMRPIGASRSTGPLAF